MNSSETVPGWISSLQYWMKRLPFKNKITRDWLADLSLLVTLGHYKCKPLPYNNIIRYNNNNNYYYYYHYIYSCGMLLCCIFMSLLSYGLHLLPSMTWIYLLRKGNLRETCLFKESFIGTQVYKEVEMRLKYNYIQRDWKWTSCSVWRVCLPPRSCRCLAAFSWNVVHFADVDGAWICTLGSPPILPAARHRDRWAPGCGRRSHNPHPVKDAIFLIWHQHDGALGKIDLSQPPPPLTSSSCKNNQFKDYQYCAVSCILTQHIYWCSWKV